MEETLRAAIVDDHPLVREGVVQALGRTSGITVVAQGGTAAEAIGIAHELEPDVMLLDLFLPGTGLAALTEIHSAHLQTKVVILSAAEDNWHVLAALRAGASGYILKGVSGPELRDAILRVHVSGSYVSPELGARLLADISRNFETSGSKRMGGLSEREQEIVALVRRGLCNKEIGYSLSLSEKTVKHYLTNVFRKLDVRNRTELALLS